MFVLAFNPVVSEQSIILPFLYAKDQPSDHIIGSLSEVHCFAVTSIPRRLASYAVTQRWQLFSHSPFRPGTKFGFTAFKSCSRVCSPLIRLAPIIFASREYRFSRAIRYCVPRLRRWAKFPSAFFISAVSAPARITSSVPSFERPVWLDAVPNTTRGGFPDFATSGV